MMTEITHMFARLWLTSAVPFPKLQTGDGRMTDYEKKALELINVRKSISTLELCRVLGVSESTARRLLLRLSDLGAIHKYHGGGMSIDYFNTRNDLHKRFELHADEKDRIAKAAASHVKPGSTLILLGGTTVYKMCKYLKGIRVTVITNSMIIFDALKDEQAVEILMLGGKFNRNEMEVRGVITHANQKMLRADSLFMGTVSFHPRIGFMTNDIDSIELYSLCMDAANTCYMLADSYKFGVAGAAVTATCAQLDCLISDNALSEDIVAAFQQEGLEVKLV